MLQAPNTFGRPTYGLSEVRTGVSAGPRKQFGGDVCRKLHTRSPIDVQELHVRTNERRKRVHVTDSAVTNEILEDPNRGQGSHGGHRDGKVNCSSARRALGHRLGCGQDAGQPGGITEQLTPFRLMKCLGEPGNP